MRADLKEAQVNIFIEIDGKLHLCGFDQEDLDAINMLIKIGVKTAYRTEKTQGELREFFGLNHILKNPDNKK